VDKDGSLSKLIVTFSIPGEEVPSSRRSSSMPWHGLRLSLCLVGCQLLALKAQSNFWHGRCKPTPARLAHYAQRIIEDIRLRRGFQPTHPSVSTRVSERYSSTNHIPSGQVSDSSLYPRQDIPRDKMSQHNLTNNALPVPWTFPLVVVVRNYLGRGQPFLMLPRMLLLCARCELSL
jgi:hypothetical protein